MDVGQLGARRSWTRASLTGALLVASLAFSAGRAVSQSRGSSAGKSPASQAAASRSDAKSANEEAASAPADDSAIDAPESSASDDSPPLYRRIGIDDPSGRALVAFHAALRRAGSGRGQARIVFYGASHVAGEMFTGPLRQRLQQRFGEAGPGFVTLAKPWSWYHHRGISLDHSRGFKPLRVKAEGAAAGGIYGLAGVALDAPRGRAARGVVETVREDGLEWRASHFALYYLRQPRGGKLSVYIDGEHRQDISTAAPSKETGYARFEASDGLHRFELRTTGDGPVRVFGVAIERNEPGVILDMLGVPGARARDQLAWDEPVYREHLASRMPDLVVLAYGTNEAGDEGVPISQYEAGLRKVVDRTRDVVPYASCLLIGPSDRPRQLPGGGYADRPLTSAIIETQRRVAAESGCGFFDLRGFMGGEMAMMKWVKAQPALGAPDHVHFTRTGYAHLASVLYDALMAGFDASAPRSEALAASPPTPAAMTIQDLSPLSK